MRFVYKFQIGKKLLMCVHEYVTTICHSLEESKQISLKFLPEGSWPTYLWTSSDPSSFKQSPYVKGFEQDCIVKGILTLPIEYLWPSTVLKIVGQNHFINQIAANGYKLQQIDCILPDWNSPQVRRISG